MSNLPPGIMPANGLSDLVSRSRGYKNLLPVNMRSPGILDDVNAGYSVGNFWVRPGPGYPLMICTDSTAGAAKWQIFQAGAPAPGDAISAVSSGAIALGAYGSIRMYNAYGTGPAYDLMNAAGAVITINFLTSDEIDKNAAYAAYNSGYIRCTKAYDHSGNANHVTFTYATAPTITPLNIWNNVSPLAFDGQSEGTAINRFGVIPAGVTMSTQAASVLMLASAKCTANNTNLLTLQTSGGATATLSFSNSSNQFGISYSGSGFTAAFNKILPCTPFVAGMILGASSTIAILDETSTTGGFHSAGTYAGGFLGSVNASGAGNCDIYGSLVFARALSTAEIQAGTGAFYRAYNLCPQARDVLVMDGDSITECYTPTLGPVGNRSWIRQVAEMLDRPMKVYNCGAFGQTTALRLSAFAAFQALAYNSNARNVIYQLFAGTNDLNAGSVSAATVYANFAAYRTAVKTLGANTKFSVVTTLPRSGFTTTAYTGAGGGFIEGQRVLLNQMLDANSIGADLVIDFAGDALLGAQANTSNGIFADGIHPAALAQTWEASLAASALNGLLI